MKGDDGTKVPKFSGWWWTLSNGIGLTLAVVALGVLYLTLPVVVVWCRLGAVGRWALNRVRRRVQTPQEPPQAAIPDTSQVSG